MRAAPTVVLVVAALAAAVPASASSLLNLPHEVLEGIAGFATPPGSLALLSRKMLRATAGEKSPFILADATNATFVKTLIDDANTTFAARPHMVDEWCMVDPMTGKRRDWNKSWMQRLVLPAVGILAGPAAADDVVAAFKANPTPLPDSMLDGVRLPRPVVRALAPRLTATPPLPPTLAAWVAHHPYHDPLPKEYKHRALAALDEASKERLAKDIKSSYESCAANWAFAPDEMRDLFATLATVKGSDAYWAIRCLAHYPDFAPAFAQADNGHIKRPLQVFVNIRKSDDVTPSDLFVLFDTLPVTHADLKTLVTAVEPFKVRDFCKTWIKRKRVEFTPADVDDAFPADPAWDEAREACRSKAALQADE